VFSKVPYGHYNVSLGFPCAARKRGEARGRHLRPNHALPHDRLSPRRIQKETEAQRRTLEKDQQGQRRLASKLEMIYRDEGHPSPASPTRTP